MVVEDFSDHKNKTKSVTLSNSDISSILSKFLYLTFIVDTDNIYEKGRLYDEVR